MVTGTTKKVVPTEKQRPEFHEGAHDVERRNFLRSSAQVALGTLIGAGVLTGLSGCSGGTSGEVQPPAASVNLTIVQSANGSVLLGLGNGKMVSVEDELALKKALEELGNIKDINLAISPAPSNPTAPPLSGSVGPYYIRLGERANHYVGGCIARNCDHVHAHVKDTRNERELVNLHFCWWSESGRRCFGIYNSANGWCRKGCGPSYDEVKSWLADMAQAALHIARWVAVVVAAVLIFLVTRGGAPVPA